MLLFYTPSQILFPIIKNICKIAFISFSRKLGIKIRGAEDKFPDFFRMGTFIDSIHMKL